MIVEGFEPKSATLALVLSICGRSSCLELGERINEFTRVRLKGGLCLYSLLHKLHLLFVVYCNYWMVASTMDLDQ